MKRDCEKPIDFASGVALLPAHCIMSYHPIQISAGGEIIASRYPSVFLATEIFTKGVAKPAGENCTESTAQNGHGNNGGKVNA